MTATMTTQKPVPISRHTAVETIRLPGRFDVHEVESFTTMAREIAQTGAVLVLDASEVSYMDRRAMDALIQTRLACMDHGGDVALAAPSAAARIILELSGRYEALNPIETDQGEPALATLQEAA